MTCSQQYIVCFEIWLATDIFNIFLNMEVDIMCVELGIKQSPLELPDSSMCLSVILYHLLKVLPVEIISMNGLAILQLVEKSVDKSHDQVILSPSFL